MGARCPYCNRQTTAADPGLYRCRGCSRVFRVLPPPAWIAQGVAAECQRLYDVLDWLGTLGEMATLEVEIVAEQLSRLEAGDE